MAMVLIQIGCNMTDNTNIDELLELAWNAGWEEAIQYVIEISIEMKDNKAYYDSRTLDELEQRIV